MKSLLATIGILFTVFTLQSQITFDQGDYPKPGITIEYYEGWSDSVEMGSAGVNQIFDFSNIVFGIEDTFDIEFVEPSSTPFGASHPNATVAFLGDTEEDSVTGKIIFEQWEYIESVPVGASYKGLTINVDTGALFSGSTPTSMDPFHSTYSPELMLIGTSFTYQQHFTPSSTWSVSMTNFKHDEYIGQDIEIDAYGIFSNPWNSFPVLRFKVQEIIIGIDTLNGQQDDYYSDTTYYFEYWAKGLGFFIARAYTDDTYTELWGYEVANQRNPIGIQESKSKSGLKIYPIPVYDVLNIEINVTDIIEYEIRNLNGSLIVWGILPSESAGRHQLNVSALHPGMYILDIKSGNQIIGKEKFIVK